jgi:hypothetical protein
MAALAVSFLIRPVACRALLDRTSPTAPGDIAIYQGIYGLSPAYT